MKDERQEKRRSDLPERTKAFALRVIRMYTALPKTTEAQVLGKQVLRSGTSVGANYREANRARSRAEFTAKVGDCLKELDETAYWMERITAVLLNQLSGIFQDRSRLILLIAATNVPWKIDEAFLRPGRLDECLYVGPPDESACLELLRLYLRDRPMAVDLLDESTLRRLGALLLGYSGADIESTMQPLRHTATAGSLKQRCR